MPSGFSRPFVICLVDGVREPVETNHSWRIGPTIGYIEPPVLPYAYGVGLAYSISDRFIRVTLPRVKFLYVALKKVCNI